VVVIPPPDPVIENQEEPSALPKPAAAITLAAPEDRTPVSGFEIGLEQLRQSRSLTFSWQEVKGANAYIFTLLEAGPDGRKNILSGKPDSATSYFLEDIRTIGRGSFLWQVEAVELNADGSYAQRGKIEGNYFTVNIPQPGAPKPREPGTLYGKPEESPAESPKESIK
jgi:hypothetical protein